MAILSIDTCLQTCSAALLADGKVRAIKTEARDKGHAERLAPLVQEVMAEAQVSFSEISKIAVAVGPGSFAGVRVGLAFARGLAIGTDIPVIGATTLEILAAGLSVHGGAVRVVLIDARRGQVYGQVFKREQLTPLCEGFVLSYGEAKGFLETTLGSYEPVFIGSGVPLVYPERKDHFQWHTHQPDPIVLAQIATGRTAPKTMPEAVYIRAADAKPAKPILAMRAE